MGDQCIARVLGLCWVVQSACQGFRDSTSQFNLSFGELLAFLSLGVVEVELKASDGRS